MQGTSVFQEQVKTCPSSQQLQRSLPSLPFLRSSVGPLFALATEDMVTLQPEQALAPALPDGMDGLDAGVKVDRSTMETSSTFIASDVSNPPNQTSIFRNRSAGPDT